MAIKTSYTDEEIQEYMVAVLGDTAEKENWTFENGDFQEPANQVLYNLGWSDFSSVVSAITAAEARAVASVEAWRMAMHNTAHYASHSVGAPGTGQTNRADVHRFCKAMYDEAVKELEGRFPDTGATYADTTRSLLQAPVIYAQDYEA